MQFTVIKNEKKNCLNLGCDLTIKNALVRLMALIMLFSIPLPILYLNFKRVTVQTKLLKQISCFRLQSGVQGLFIGPGGWQKQSTP